MSLGGPGLFFIAFLDSSFLSLPEINDLLVVWMVTRQKELMLYYAAMATFGSMTGCLVLYAIGRKGGDALLRRRFQAGRLDRAMTQFKRYGVLAILVPALLPPPAPFKVFVLMAGVAGMPILHFAGTIAVGRGLRYLIGGLLAVRYGDQAIDFIHQNGQAVSIVLASLALLGGIAYVVWRRYRKPEGEAASQG